MLLYRPTTIRTPVCSSLFNSEQVFSPIRLLLTVVWDFLQSFGTIVSMSDGLLAIALFSLFLPLLLTFGLKVQTNFAISHNL